MNAIQLQTDFFNDNSENGLLRQEFILLYASAEKVRRGCFAKIGAIEKKLDKFTESLLEENKALKAEIIAIKKFIGMPYEESSLDTTDLPLLQFA